MNQPHSTFVSLTKPLAFLLVFAFCFAGMIRPVEAGPRIKESRLDRSKDDVREPLYTEWMDPYKVDEFVGKQAGFPLYQEVNRKGESRVLLVKNLQRARYYYYCLLSEEYLVRKHRELTAQKYTLITLSEDADGRFSATWVDSKSVDAYKKKLDELGISMATLEE